MNTSRRAYCLMGMVVFLGAGVLLRLFFLQVLQSSYYKSLAQDQHQIYRTLFPQRGEIFLQDLSRKDDEENYYPLAINKEFQQVYLVPKDVPDEKKDFLAERLSVLLDIGREIILQRANKPDDPYEPLKHKVDSETANKAAAFEIEGLRTAPEEWRYYPNDYLASHLSGFVGMSEEERVGQYGLEGYYEDELKGSSGFFSGGKDTSGYGIPMLKKQFEQAKDGSKLILTVDQNIQFKAEKELRETIERWQAEQGSIVIMNPATGAILAMANYPSFNPNQYNEVEDIDIFLNSAIQEAYEPGSVFKPITMAVGLDTGKVKSDGTYTDKGRVVVSGNVISNVDGKVYGEQTMTQILQKSLNTGAVYVQQETDREVFQDYIQRFNFNKPTGIDLMGETGGNIFNLFTGRDIDLATISFGQGITVTPIGLLTAIASIANNGKLVKPFVVQKIIDAHGVETITEPQVASQVVSPQTAHDLTKMLVKTVEKGCGGLARVAGYSIAGKTGTAQLPDFEKGGYMEDDTIHSFVGFAPAFDPQFAILIKIDKPRGIRFAANSVGPVFRRLAEYLFNYLEIPPQ